MVLPISSRQDNMQPYYDVASLQTYKDIDPVNARLDGISDSKPWWFGEEAKLRPGVRIWWMLDDWCLARCLFQSCAWSGRIHTWNSWMRCDHILWFTYYSSYTSIWSKTLWSTYDRWIEMWVGRDLIWTSSIRWATKTARPGVLHPHLSECLSEISRNHALDSESCF